MSHQRRWHYLVLVLLGVLMFVVHLWMGAVPLHPYNVLKALLGISADPMHELIVRGVRLPQAITAMVAGAGLAACGLLMQTLFRNPLAGPSVLGISSGASLGVALVLLAQPLWILVPLPRDAGLIAGSLAGAIAVLILILLADRRVGDGITLLIIGLMLGYLCSALISVLQVASPAPMLKGFVLWGMGSFAGVTTERLPWLLVPALLGITASLLLVKSLNALLLGEDQAATLGVPVRRMRTLIMCVTGILAGTITAFCGPIAFLGLATPHVARGIFRTSDHARLMPATMLCGAVLALLCDLLARSPGMGMSLPLNAVTSLLGAPVVAWVLLSGKRWARAS